MRARHPHHRRIAGRCRPRIGQAVDPDMAIILLPNPSLAGQIGAGQQLLQRGQDRHRLGQRHGLLAGRCQRRHRAIILRRLIDQGGNRNHPRRFAMPLHFQHGFGDQAAHHHRVQIPFGKNRLRLGRRLRFQHHQHPFLAFRQHNLIGLQIGLPQRHCAEIQADTDATLAGHFAGAAGQPRRPHILNRDNRILIHQLQTGFD